jgi:hypothetical protein
MGCGEQYVSRQCRLAGPELAGDTTVGPGAQDSQQGPLPAGLAFLHPEAYGINNNVFDIFVMLAFGMAGYLLKKRGMKARP